MALQPMICVLPMPSVINTESVQSYRRATMSQPKYLKILACLCAVTLSPFVLAQTVSTVVTIERKKPSTEPVQRENVLVFESGKRAPITSWQPFTGDHAGLQLLILVDDSSGSALGGQLDDVRTFIQALPPTTEVGVAYMHNGEASVLQAFTADHALAAKAIRLPQSTVGGGSPYFTLSEVAKHWPGEAKALRREILMICDGVDRYSEATYSTSNPYVTKAISDSQRAGILVHTIFYRGAGTPAGQGTPGTQEDEYRSSGQSYLFQISKETGGKCFQRGVSNPVSLIPALNELTQLLTNQYELVFQSRARPQNGLVDLSLKSEAPGVKLLAPEKVAPIP